MEAVVSFRTTTEGCVVQELRSDSGSETVQAWYMIPGPVLRLNMRTLLIPVPRQDNTQPENLGGAVPIPDILKKGFLIEKGSLQ